MNNFLALSKIRDDAIEIMIISHKVAMSTDCPEVIQQHKDLSQRLLKIIEHTDVLINNEIARMKAKGCI